MRTFLTLLLPVPILAGCAGFTHITADEAGPYPQSYRETVKAAVRAEFFDPTSIHDAFLTEPFPAKWLLTNGWGVCLRTNAKNRMGGYAGQQEYGYLFQNGAIVAEGDFIDCNTAQYAPWPEIEGMTWSTSPAPEIAQPAPAPMPQPSPASSQRPCTQQEETQKRIAIKNGYSMIPNCQ